VFHQGDPSDYVCVVESGLVKLTQACANGRLTIVALRGRQSLLGIDAVLLGTPRSVTAIPLSESVVVRVPVDDFQRRLWTSRKLSWYAMREQCLDEVRSHGRIASFACLGARERLEAVIAQVTDDFGHREGVPVPLRDWELAQLVGVTPQYLCVLVHELRSEGLLERRGERWWWKPRLLD
jgi:CRP-like cAMP-binding protein